MKLVSRTFLGLALTSILAACNGGSESTGTADAAEEQVASDGTEAMAASVQSTHLGSIVFSGVGSEDPATAATQLSTATELYPAGCVTRAKDPTNPEVVDVTFKDCISSGTTTNNGTAGWTKQTASWASNVLTVGATSGYMSVVEIYTSQFAAGYDYLQVTGTNCTVTAILHDLTVQRGPANLAILGA